MKSSLHSPTGRCKTCPPAHPSPLTLCPPLSRSQPVPKTLTPCRPAPPSRLSGPLSGMLSRGSARWFLCAPQDAAERSRRPRGLPEHGEERAHPPSSRAALSACTAFSAPLARWASACCGLHCRLPRAQDGAAHIRSVLNV